MATQHCAHCGDSFQPRPQSLRQTFCSTPACQRARKRLWQKDKLQTDPDYRANQRSAQRAWAARNGGYWRDWRQARHTSTPRGRAQPARTDAPRRAPVAMQSYGEDVLNLVLARGYLVKLLDNKAVARFLTQRQADVMAEFRAIVETVALDKG